MSSKRKATKAQLAFLRRSGAVDAVYAAERDFDVAKNWINRLLSRERQRGARPSPGEDPIKIDHGIPLPTRTHGNSKYPFAQMSVGDSFFVKGPRPTQGTLVNAANAWAKAHRAKTGVVRRFATRAVAGGVRVWRVEAT